MSFMFFVFIQEYLTGDKGDLFIIHPEQGKYGNLKRLTFELFANTSKIISFPL